MRHGVKGRKLGLTRGKRKAFLKTLAGNLIKKERILTTEARAKEVRPLVERFISYGKRRNLQGLRLLLQKLPKEAAFKVYYEISPRYESRRGGYVRIVKRVSVRRGDGAKMATIEFV